MNDPRSLDIGDWVGLAGTALLAGIGGAMAWFRTSTAKLHARMQTVEDEMKEWDRLHAAHTTQLAVVETCQQNTAERLGKIDETTRDTNAKIEHLNETLTQVLLAIQRK